MVALLIMLLAADNGFQSCLVAPTEILSNQHALNFTEMLAGLPVQVRLLTGSVKSAARKAILEELANGAVNILMGTHAVLENLYSFIIWGDNR